MRPSLFINRKASSAPSARAELAPASSRFATEGSTGSEAASVLLALVCVSIHRVRRAPMPAVVPHPHTMTAMNAGKTRPALNSAVTDPSTFVCRLPTDARSTAKVEDVSVM